MLIKNNMYKNKTLKREILKIIEKYKKNGEISITISYDFESSSTGEYVTEGGLDEDRFALEELIFEFKECEYFNSMYGYGNVRFYFHEKFKLTCCFTSYGFDEDTDDELQEHEYEINENGFEIIKIWFERTSEFIENLEKENDY